MVSFTLGGAFRIEGLDLNSKRDALLADAEACARAAPGTVAVIEQRLGSVAKAKRMTTLAELGRGLVVVRPADARAMTVDAPSGQLGSEQAEVLDQIVLHLGHVAWKHCKELASWTGPEILCNALVLGPHNQPTPGFWVLARFSGRSPGSLAAAAQKDAVWAREVNRVHDWFAQLQVQHRSGT
jgi:hypothetical protein